MPRELIDLERLAPNAAAARALREASQ